MGREGKKEMKKGNEGGNLKCGRWEQRGKIRRGM
jgi:hypothetical protein